MDNEKKQVTYNSSITGETQVTFDIQQKNDRIYIEKGNQICLGEVHYFTFEPHISVQGSKYGYKRENIYYFENGEIKEL